MNCVVIIDGNYIAHRAFHSMGQLSWRMEPTGVIYGFMREIVTIQKQFDPSHVVFCFDHGDGLREKAEPTYKEKRRAKAAARTPEERSNYEGLYKQIDLIRYKHLPDIGFQNLYWQNGFEADDIIASVVHNLHHDDQAIIISADKDLFQLIQPDDKVICYNPHTKGTMRYQKFHQKYKLKPEQWALVKAIGGCDTDDVIGVPGVGDIKACWYITGQMKADSKLSMLIHESWHSIVKRNLHLVQLPYPGTKDYFVVNDKFNHAKWLEVADMYGMNSIRTRYVLERRS